MKSVFIGERTFKIYGVSYLKNSVSQSDYTYIADNRLVDNMKKTILCFLLIMLTLICCIECSQSASYKVLEAGGYDSVVNANHKAEFDNFLNTSVEKSVETQRSFQINDKKYDVSYQNTTESYMYNASRDNYISDNALISVNKATGSIDTYYESIMDASEYTVGSVYSEEALVQTAQDYLKKYIDDISGYQMIGSKSRTVAKTIKCYEFEFARFVGDVETYDKAYIGVTEYGTVIDHLFVGLGEMADAKPISDNELELIRKSVDAKLSDIYDSVKDKYSVTYEIDKPILTKIYDGSTILEYGISVNFKSVSGTDVLKSEHLTLIVYVDD